MKGNELTFCSIFHLKNFIYELEFSWLGWWLIQRKKYIGREQIKWGLYSVYLAWLSMVLPDFHELWLTFMIFGWFFLLKIAIVLMTILWIAQIVFFLHGWPTEFIYSSRGWKKLCYCWKKWLANHDKFWLM